MLYDLLDLLDLDYPQMFQIIQSAKTYVFSLSLHRVLHKRNLSSVAKETNSICRKLLKPWYSMGCTI